jgi:quercetin dioxygenase-like cupin family protein
MAEALKERWFENAAMGHRARLVTLPSETAGRSFVLEYVNRPFAGEFAVPAHFHPATTETFEILQGRARYRIGGEERSAEPGERLILPAGMVHVHPWSASNEELHVRQVAVADPPDLAGLTASLQAAITIFGLATAGRVNSRGMPGLLQIAVLAETTMPATYVAGPPIAVQRLLIGGLAAIGRALGYRASYPEFGVLSAGQVAKAPEDR